MLKVRSRVADVPGVVWVLNRSLFIVAIMLALLVSAGVAYAQGTPTVPTIESVAVTSDPGEDGGYAIGDEIQVGLTFSEAVTVTGVPQISLDVGGRSRTAEYSEGSTTTQLLFTYTVPSGDEDTDGIAVVADSLALNGGAIRAGSANATLTHAGLNSADHKVDGIAPTVTVDGETRTYVPPGRQFNVVFNFSEKVYGITDDEITVTNGLAVDVRATGGTDTWPRYTRWDVIVVPAAEGPVTVTLEAGAGADAYGNGNTAPDSALEVIAATPVTVEVARTTSGFAEGGRAEFTVTRSRDNGAIPVFLSLDQTGDLLSGSVEVYPPADPNNPSEPVVPEEFTFTETPFNLNVTFAAGETSKRIAVPTEDDYRDEEDGTVTLSVPARPDQYKYIPGHASSATADVRDNDVPVTVSLYWIRSFHPYTHSNLDTALEGGSISLVVYGRATGQPLQVTLAVTEVGSYLDLDGDGAWGYENLGNGKLLVTLPVDLSFQNVVIPLVENDVREADGSVTITIEPDTGGSYIPSATFGTLTIPVKDNDTPSTVSISAADDLTEGAQLSYTLTRTWAPGQIRGELSVNVELAQTGDYITWPTAHQPDADGLVTIPVNFAARSLTATLTLDTVDDQVSEDSGSVTATILADAGDSYVTGADSAHTTQLMDNDPPIISVSAVSAEVTEGTDAQFRFSRSGNTGVATRVGLYVGGLPKIMTDATEATVLASQENTVRIYGASVDYILEFAAGEAEKTLSFTTEADNVNEGDGWLGVRIVQRVANPFSIGTGYAQALVKDDDIPTVSLTRPVGPTGLTLSADGTTWEGQIVEGGEFTYSSVCTGVTEFSEDQRNNLVPLSMSVLYSDHPAFYGEEAQDRLGNNQAGVRSVGADCVSATVTNGVRNLFVGPENGVLEIELLPQSELVVKGSPSGAVHPKVFAEFITKYEDAATAAQAAGTLITQKGLFHPIQLGYYYRAFACNETDDRYCPKYLVGTVNKIRLTVINRDPVILIKAENSEVDEGQPARFVVERMWSKDLLALQAPHSTTVVSLRASQNGQYITGALPAEIAFGQNETRKVIELQTVDDGAFGDDGSVTIELLPDTTGASVNLQGKYTTWEIWQGHTPEGGRSDRATVTITNDDDKPGISFAPASALEGDSGTADMTFTVTLAYAVTEAVTVNYATSDGTAIAGQDYTAVSNGSVTIAAGNTTAEFTVSMTGDETDELDETFNVTISMPEPEPNLNGGSSGEPVAAITGGDTAAAVGTILDDDPAVVTVAPKKSPVTEGEEVVFVLTRTGVTDEELYMLVDVEDPARRRLMIAKFDADAVTTELSVATENNDLVDYPSERDYTIHLYGDGYFGDRDDERYTPGDPDEATVTVQDNDALVVVTVEPVKEVVGAGESVQFRFRRTGSIAGALTISFQGFEHPSSGDATLADASVTFLADNDTVVYTNDVTSSGTVNPISRAHTVLIYGDAGRGGLHRSWIAGNPNRATVVVAVDALGPMPVTASYPGRVAAAETVSVEYTVTNLGTRALLGYENRVSDGTRISTTPDRGNCDIRDEIPAGESRTCSASFTVTNQDVTNGKIEFNATARNLHKSSTLRVYIRVAQPVEFGFTTADNLEVTEGPNVTAILPVTRTGRLNEAVTVTYQLRPHGTRPATLGEDFTDPSSTPGLLTFPANVTSANIVINITQDQIDEERERFRVVLVPLADGTITEGKESRVVLVKDEHQENDPYRPTASLQLVSSGPVPENEGPVEFAIVLDRVWGREGRYEVEVLLDQSTATPGFAALGKEGDFEEPLIRILRIPAGQTRFEFSVPLYDDDVREEDETFLLHLTSPYDDSFRTIGASNRALATIADDDRVPPTEVVLSLSHNGSALESAPEGSTQQDITVTATFPQIRWPGDASNAPLRPADPRDVDTTVRVQVDPNSGATHAAGPDDFAPLKVEDDQGDFLEIESFDIVIPAGQTSGTVTLRFRPVNDDVDEEDETVTLLGSELVAGDSAGSLPVRSASFTIIDDDTRGITVSPSSALIGLSLVEGGEPGTYSLVLDSQPTDTVVITLAGNQGGFLRLVPDTLTFTSSDWATPQTVSVVALDDGIAGGAGSQDVIAHQVSGGDYGSVTAPDISVNITDTTKAFVYLEGGQASESDGHVEFTVTVRPILRTTPVLVRYATVDGTAIAGSDYTREVETGQTYKILNIPAGQSSATIRIPIIDNQVYESADETFTLQLTNHNNKATLDGDATSLTATGAIADDDPKPVVSVAGPAGEVSYVSENAKDPVTFTLTLVGQSAGDVTVDYATGEAGLLDLFTARQGLAGATENEDYAGTSGTVTFTSGQTTKTVTVQVTDDDVSEDTEFFGFRISSPQGADLRGQRSEVVADVGLVDDDARGVTIDPTSISLDEPASGETAVAGSYTVNLKSRPTDTVTVTIGGGDPAVSLSGDTLTNNQLTFTTTNWNTAQTITVTPVKDDNAAGETVTLTHTVSGGDYAGIAADSVTVNLTDSDTRNLVLSEESIAVTEGDATGVGYTVKLATQPSDTVTVAISGHDGADLTLSGTTLTNNQLTFTTTNWGTAQTVTVKAGDDDNTDDESETLAHTASGGDYVNITKDLPVSITDDGEVPVTVQFGATIYEVVEGETVTVAVTLSADPERTVVIPITHTPQSGATSPADYSGVPTSVTFNTGQMSKTITFTAAQDEVDDDGERVLLGFGTLPPAVSLGTTTQATVSITDDDTAAVVLSETDLTVTEGGAAGSSYTVVLATQPSDTVNVTISGHDGTDLTLDKTTLTFTVDNWATAQTVMVKAGQDDDGANDTATLTHTASGGDYASVSNTLPVTVTDDDTAGVTIEPTTLSVVAGRSNEYTVALATEPTGDVTVTISGHASTDVRPDNTTLTFMVGNWSMAQTVTVSAAQSASTGKVTLAHAVSGADYASVSADSVVVSVVAVAAQQPTLQVGVSSSTQTLTVPEGASNSYALILSSRPTGDVAIGVTLPAGTDLSLDKTSLTFTVDNWDDAQTVTVTAEEDDDGVTDAGVTLTHTISGGGYGSTTVPDVEVSITENDSAGLVISKDSLTVGEGDAAGSSYTVSLATQPSGSVSVAITGHAGTDLTLDKTTLTFTVDNWDVAQTVTVKAGQDDDGANDTASLTHTASGGDYASVSNTLPVTVTDDDTADIVLSETGLTVTEGDAAGSSYTVRLATQPSGSVSVAITGHAGTDLTLSSDMLTFTVDNWDDAQTVTVEGGEDADGANDTATLTHTASGGDYASVSNTLPVTVTDDDAAGVTIEPTALSVVAGRSNEYAVALATEPTGDVTVTVSGHASTDVTLDKTTLTFTVDNWDTAQTVTVSATQNAATAKVTLAHAVVGTDYGSVTAEPVVVSVVAAAGEQLTLQIGVSSSAQTLTVPEGGANSYTLVLGSRPTGDVTVGVTLPAGTDLTLNKTSLTFTSTNWDVAQTVTVTAAEDDDAVTDAGVTLTHTVSGGGYGSTTVPDVEVSITENDTAGVVLSETDLTVTEGDATGIRYTVKLATQPSDTVTVTISGHDGADLTLSGTTLTNNQLTFTTTSWGTAQTVTVKAGDDDNTDNESETLAHTASGGDYVNITKDLPVSITDDGDPQVTVQFGATLYEVVEGAEQSVTVTLSADPERTVVIPITHTPQSGADSPADYSGVPSSVTFSSGQTYTSFPFMAAQDDLNDDGESVKLTFGMLPARVSAGTTATTTVSITDDDTPPTAANGTVTTDEDTAHTFAADEFGNADADGDALAHVKIIELPAAGTGALTLNGTAIPSADLPKTVTATELTGGGLKYAPPANANGTGYASFKFKVNDGTADSASEYFMTINVTAVNDPATGTPTISGTAQGGQMLTASTGDIADPDGVPSAFTYQWKRYAADRITFEANIGTDSMTYTLTASEEGKKVLVEVSFTDNGGSSEGPLVSALYPSTQSQTVDPNNPPTASDGTVTTVEDTAHSFAAANFSYSDTDGDALAHVKIIELPAAGTGALTLNGTAITSVDLPKTVTAAELTENKLTYSPPANANGTGYASFKFKVNDGTEDSSSEYFMTINVTAVNDPATGAPTISGTAHVGLTLTASTAGIDDVDGLPSAFTYQWKRVDADGTSNPTDIGADSSAYTLTAAEEGKKVLVEVSFTDNGGSSEGPLVSAAYPSSGTVVNLTVSFGETTYEVVEGETVTVAVTLSADPERTVAIPITATPQDSASSADYTVPTSVTFNAGDMSKTITFTAAQDAEDDDGESVLLAFGILPDGVSPGTRNETTVSITDDDVPQVTVSFGQAAYTVAEGGTQSVTVTLSADPERTVVIPITHTPQDGADSPADYSGVPPSVTFNTGQMSQTITFEAIQDDVDDDGESALLGFGTLPPAVSLGTTTQATVSITDDDGAGVSVSESSLTIAEGSSGTYTIVLDSQPTADVAVAINDPSNTDVTAEPTSLTFSSTDWSSPKTVTVNAAQDADAEGETATVTHTVTSTYSSYSAASVNSVAVMVTDDEVPVTVQFGATTYEVVEGETVTVAVTLSADPERTVVVPITATPQDSASSADYTVPTSVTFNTGQMSQTITFTAAQDEVDDDGESVLLGFGAPLPGGVSLGTTVTTTVSITDDDGAGVSVSESSLTIAEGGSGTYTIVLDSQPTADVTVTINDPSNTDVTAEPTSLTFSSTDWSSPKTVTVNAAQDADAEGETATVTHTVTSTDSSYSAASANSVAVTITDDDPQQGDLGGNVGRRGTVITIERVPDGTVIPDHSSLWVGATVEDGSTFIEGTQALFRLKFEAVGGGPPVGTGVDVDLRFSWQIPSPLVTTHGQVGSASFSLHRVDVWDTAVRIHDNDVGHPDGTLTIRIIGCERSDCMIGTPSQITLTIADDDGGPEAAIPGPPDLPSLVCARSGDGYDDTGIAVSWKAPNFVGGAPVESYELRYRQSSRFVGGTLVEHQWESWPHGVAATSATLTGLVTRANYTVEVRAVSAIGPGQWSEPNYFRVGPTDEVCEIIDQLTPQPLNPPQPDSARQSLSNAPAQGEPRIDGIPEVGQTLSADTTAIADADGLEEVVFEYQWLAEDADIPDATGGTYTVAPGDVGKAIMVRVAFTDDAGQEETLTSASTAVVTVAGLQLQSATVDGSTLTLTYNEVLDTGVTLGTTPFAVSVNGSSRSLIAVGVGESNVLLLLSQAVEAGDTVTVDYTAPDSPDFIRDIRGRKAASFSGQAVTNDTASAQDNTASAPLTASAHDAPSSHNGQDAFTFELRFSEDPKSDFSYATVRDHAFTVTGGSVTYVRRLEPGKNVRWEITVTPGSGADVTIALNATTDCSAQGAICTEDGGKLSGGLLLVVLGPNAPATPNTPATDAPTISGTARVGETLTADTTGIYDGDGLDNATFAYQWLADNAEIDSATASSYTLVAADAGKAIKVRVSFTDDAGNDEELISAATGAVAAAPPPLNTPATGAPTITGTAEVGETLTADTTGISDDDGLDNATFACQWLADDAEINGANASTYTLADDDAGKTIKVRVSFTDDAGNEEQLTSAMTGAVAAAAPRPNTPATGAPTITGAAQVGETLTADTTGISDDDGLDNATFAYQWLDDDAEINGANASTYTLADDDAGKTIKVRVSFTDDAGNDEQLTSAVTGAVTAAVVKPPLTASAHDVPSSHNGQDAFIFELRFSEEPEPDFSYTTVRDHAFTVTGGSVTYVRRLEPGKNVRWEITVTHGSSADVAIALNATTDCEAGGAICTEDGRMLSGELELTVNGPE